MSDHAVEVSVGKRFEFGANWSNFLAVLDDKRIEEAKRSLQKMLNMTSLQGKTFIDIGSGSGLFSLAAKMLGAKVHSFDYDPKSVNCTQELKRRYFPNDKDWIVEAGSVLDKEYMAKLGQFDIVYSWGVLHHTGQMWDALGNVSGIAKPNGKMFIAIYNDQGGPSRRWYQLKKAYNKFPILRNPLAVYTLFRQWTITLIKDAIKGNPFHSWINYKQARGMSAWYDIVDWIGGYPFEVAKPEEIFEFYKSRGFVLEKMNTCAGGLGCNEFVFLKLNLSDSKTIP